MSRQCLEVLVSVTAGAIMALMVAAGGAAVAGQPSDALIPIEATEAEHPDPLTICSDDGESVTCVRAET